MSIVPWSFTSDVDELLTAAGDWLRARPAENTVALSVAESLRVGGPPAAGDVAMGWWVDEHGPVGGAFLHTPPYPLLLTDLRPGAAAELADALAGRTLSQVSGDWSTADAFTHEWLRLHPGSTTTVAMRQRLYRLGELVEPASTPGASRRADTADRELLVAWRTAFHREIEGLAMADVARQVDSTLGYGGLTLWTVDGAPVSLASLTRPVAGMVRVGGVYTPPEHRRRGYAAAVVASVSRSARDAGVHEVVLFTDLANPTSNAIYQRLGYRPVEDRVVLDLHPGGDRRQV